MKKIKSVEKELLRMKKNNELYCNVNDCTPTPYMEGNTRAINEMLLYIKNLKVDISDPFSNCYRPKKKKKKEILKQIQEENKMTNWELVDTLNWGRGTTDYESIKVILHRYYPDKIEEFQKFVRTKQKELMNKLDDYAEVMGDKRKYWKMGDDSFSDLTAHIVGCGEEMYDLIMSNPSLAHSILYTESFIYIFNPLK